MALIRTSTTPIAVAKRVNSFTYAIRNIIVEAQRVEATGVRVRYLNIGDPIAFGNAPRAHAGPDLGRLVDQLNVTELAFKI